MYRPLCVILYLTLFVGYTTAKSRPKEIKVFGAQCRRPTAPSFLTPWTDRDICDTEVAFAANQAVEKLPASQLARSNGYDEIVGLPNFVLFQEFNIIEAIPADQRDAFCIRLLTSSNEHLCPNIIEDEFHRTEVANRETLRLWLLGIGKQPISWSTLIEVFRDINLLTAAEVLISNLELSSNLKGIELPDAHFSSQDCGSTDSELQSTKISDPPDILLLQKFNVFKEIANEHEAAIVGTYLLMDYNGSKWKKIKTDAHSIEDRNRAVFEKWLRKPVTWSILIDVLNKSRLQRLSENLLQLIEQCALHSPSYQYSYSKFISYNKIIKESYKSQDVIKFSRVQKSLQNRNFLPLSLRDDNGAPLNLTTILNGHQKRWIITGQPGSGKTSLMRYIAKEWSERRALISCQFLFLLHLRECEGKYQSLSDLLKVSYADYDGIEQIATEIQSANGNATCLLLDGYDEKNEKDDIVYRMLNDNKLPHSIRILTSRSGYIENYDNKIGHAEIIGFDMNSLDKYLLNLTDNNSMTINKVHTIWKDQNVKDMCRLPLHMVMVIYIAAETSDISIQTKTDLYRSFLFATTDHFEPLDDDRDWNTSTLQWCIMSEEKYLIYYDQQLCRSFKELLEIAYNMLKHKETSFPSFSSLKNDINVLGFTDMIDVNVNFAKEVQYVFPHRTFQEFFAALHLITLSQEQQLVQLLKEEHHNVIDQVMSSIFSGFHPFLRFYFGLLGYFYEDNPIVAISPPFKQIVAQRTYQYTCPTGQQFIHSVSLLDLHREIGLKGKKNTQLLQSTGIVLNHSVCLDISKMSSFSSMEYLVNYSAFHQIHVCDRQHIRHDHVTAMTIEDWNNPLNASHLNLLDCAMIFIEASESESSKECYSYNPRMNSIVTSLSLITSKSSTDDDMTENDSQTLASKATNTLASGENMISRLAEMGSFSEFGVDSRTVGSTPVCKFANDMFSNSCEEDQQNDNCELLSVVVKTLCQPRDMLNKELLVDARDKLQKFYQDGNQNPFIFPLTSMLNLMISISQTADDSNKHYSYKKSDELVSKTSGLIDMFESAFSMPLNDIMMSGLNLAADKDEGFNSILQNLVTYFPNLTSVKLEITRSHCDKIANSPRIMSMLSALPIVRVKIECCETYLDTILTSLPSTTDLSLHLEHCHSGALSDLKLAIKLPRLQNLFVEHPSENLIQLISDLRQLQSISVNDYAFSWSSDVNLLNRIIGRNRELHTLQISQSSINVNVLVEILLKGTNIQHLRLGRNGLNDDDVATLGRAFKNMKHLKTLDLYSNDISGKGILTLVHTLDGAVYLQSLNLANNHRLTENWDEIKVLSNLTKLRALYITGCTLDPTHLSTLIETLPKLNKHLELLEMGDFHLLDEDEEELIKLYKAIYHLDLKHLKIVELVYRVN